TRHALLYLCLKWIASCTPIHIFKSPSPETIPRVAPLSTKNERCGNRSRRRLSLQKCVQGRTNTISPRYSRTTTRTESSRYCSHAGTVSGGRSPGRSFDGGGVGGTGEVSSGNKLGCCDMRWFDSTGGTRIANTPRAAFPPASSQITCLSK